jgi:hypothetical protein
MKVDEEIDPLKTINRCHSKGSVSSTSSASKHLHFSPDKTYPEISLDGDEHDHPEIVEDSAFKNKRAAHYNEFKLGTLVIYNANFYKLCAFIFVLSLNVVLLSSLFFVKSTFPPAFLDLQNYALDHTLFTYMFFSPSNEGTTKTRRFGGRRK